jgi:hypothetical protein
VLKQLEIKWTIREVLTMLKELLRLTNSIHACETEALDRLVTHLNCVMRAFATTAACKARSAAAQMHHV